MTSVLPDVVFVPSEEHEALRIVVRDFAADTMPVKRVRELIDSADGVDRRAWRRLAGEPMLAALGIPETYGGAGFGPRETAVVCAELGATLAFPSYLTTAVLVPSVLLAAVEDGDGGAERVAADWLPRVAGGEALATVAHDAGIAPSATSQLVRAERTSAGWRLHGRQDHVPDAAAADLLLVAAETGEGLGLFACESSSLARAQTLPGLDLTRRSGRVWFDATPAVPAAAPASAPGVIERGLDRAVAALAMEQVGGAGRALDGALAYVRERHQFGRPVGSFQAVKHLCADLLVDLETARSAAAAAVEAAARDVGTAEAASLAGAWCAPAYVGIASEALHLHGGIGFTWEHDAHLYFRRARADAALFGTPARHRRRLAELLGLAVHREGTP